VQSKIAIFVLAAFAGCLSAIAVAAFAAVVVWPKLKAQVVGDLKQEVKDQRVVPEATSDALRGLVAEGRKLLGM
jgi:hypothetical protein